MARASSLEIREAVADQIRNHYSVEITDLDIQVEPRMVFNPTPPTIDLVPNTPARDPDTEAFFGPGDEVHGAYRFHIRLRVAGDETAQQELLFGAMDETDDLCLANALLDDPTLNGYAGSVSVDAPTGFEIAQDLVEKPLLSVRFPVIIIAGDS